MDQDVFVNAVGGVRISEPAATWPCLAIQSCCAASPRPKASSLSARWAWWARWRPAPRGQERLKEAAKLGFGGPKPGNNAPAKPIEGLQVHAIERIDEAVDVVRQLQQ